MVLTRFYLQRFDITSILNFDLEILLKVTAKSLSKDIADEKWARLEKGGVYMVRTKILTYVCYNPNLTPRGVVQGQFTFITQRYTVVGVWATLGQVKYKMPRTSDVWQTDEHIDGWMNKYIDNFIAHEELGHTKTTISHYLSKKE